MLDLYLLKMNLQQAIVDSCKLLIDNDILDDESLGFRTGKIDLRVSNWNDEQYKKISEAIEEERRRQLYTIEYMVGNNS